MITSIQDEFIFSLKFSTRYWAYKLFYHEQIKFGSNYPPRILFGKKPVFYLFLLNFMLAWMPFDGFGQSPECFSNFIGTTIDETADCSGSCQKESKYQPNLFLETPVRKVRVMLHVIQKNDGSDNFQDNPTDRLYLQNVFASVNSHYSNMAVLTDDGTPPSIPSIDMRIRVQIEDIRFYQNSYYWHSANALEGAKEEMYDQFVAGQPNTDPDIIHVFITGCRLGAGGQQVFIIGGVAFLPWYSKPTIMETAWYASYANAGFNTNPENAVVINIAHELAHGMGLYHKHLSGDLMDTGYSNSNQGWGLTLGQIARMNYWLENPKDGNNGKTYKAVATDYRTKDDSHDIVIHNGEIEEWCVDKKLNTDIKIETGGELIIKCEMGMATDAFIYVERGGRLILDGPDAKITHNKTKWFALDPNSVEDRWLGIMVEGNTNVYQSSDMRQNTYMQQPSDPGIVLIKNGATLEYAYMAINGQSNKPWPDAPDYWGGFVYAENAHFVNNRWGVQFMKYNKPSYSAFINCEFTSNPDAEPAIAIKNWAETNISVENCLFDGVAGGVLTFDGNMDVLNSVFKNITIGVGRGVWVGGTSPLSSSCTIKGDPASFVYNFSNVDQGVYFGGANVNIIDNNFANNTIDIVGIGNSTYNIRKNIMNYGLYGVDLNSTGTFGNNRVNCNNIFYKSLGMTITGENYGLKFNGNIFKNNWTDASLYAAADGTFAHIPTQGSMSKPAMNQFTNKDLGTWGFYGNILTNPGNDQNISFDYFYPISPNPATIRTKPICSSNDPCSYNGNDVWQNFQTISTLIPFEKDVCKDGGPFLAPELAFWEEIKEKLKSGDDAGADQLLVNKGTPLAKKARIGVKLRQGDLSGAKNLLDAYSNEAESDKEFVGIQRINIDRLGSRKKYSLSDENRDFLFKVAKTEGENAGYANSLLYLLEGVSFKHRPRTTAGNSQGSQSTDNSESSKKLSVSPNPTSDIVRLDWSAFNLLEKEGHVVIRNRMGLVIKRFDIMPGENWRDIDIRNHEDGIYFYYFILDGKEMDAGQLVLSKN